MGSRGQQTALRLLVVLAWAAAAARASSDDHADDDHSADDHADDHASSVACGGNATDDGYHHDDHHGDAHGGHDKFHHFNSLISCIAFAVIVWPVTCAVFHMPAQWVGGVGHM